MAARRVCEGMGCCRIKLAARDGEGHAVVAFEARVQRIDAPERADAGSDQVVLVEVGGSARPGGDIIERLD
jgi:hypothetical protein